MRARHKYRAVAVTVGGRRYASKAEGRYAMQLAWQRDAGMVVGWLEQVPFRFPCGTKYVADFLVFRADGTCELVEIKGMETAAWKIKERMMAQHYPWIPLRVIRAKDVK